jgi:hypothetical protein
MKRHRHLLVVALVLMAVPLVYAVIALAARPKVETPYLEPAAPNTTCILPKERMRYDHMKYLKGLRDEVLREGKADALIGAHPRGLGSCRGCHAQREQFCDRCHQRASVQLDCFGCHTY